MKKYRIYLFVILIMAILTSCGKTEHKLYGGDTLYVSTYVRKNEVEIILPLITNWKFKEIEMKKIESNIDNINYSFFCDEESTDSYKKHYLFFGKITLKNLTNEEYEINKMIFNIDNQEFSYIPNVLKIKKYESCDNVMIRLSSCKEISPHVIGSIYYKEKIYKETMKYEHTMDFALSNLFLGETKIDSLGIYYNGEKNMKFDIYMPEFDSDSLIFYTYSLILKYYIDGNEYVSFNEYNGHLINTFYIKAIKTI